MPTDRSLRFLIPAIVLGMIQVLLVLPICFHLHYLNSVKRYVFKIYYLWMLFFESVAIKRTSRKLYYTAWIRCTWNWWSSCSCKLLQTIAWEIFWWRALIRTFEFRNCKFKNLFFHCKYSVFRAFRMRCCFELSNQENYLFHF